MILIVAGRARAMQDLFSDGAIDEMDELDVKLMNELATSVPGGRLVLVEGAGHHLHVDKPQALVAPVLEMIERVKDEGGKR